MFGLTEITAVFDEPAKQAIIPTFVLPFTIVGMAVTSIATWIAAIFGVKLKMEGPKRLFELLVKPKVLIIAVLSNFLFYGIYWGGRYIYNSSRPMWLVHLRNAHPISSNLDYSVTAEAAKVSLGNGLELVWENDLKESIYGGVAVAGNSIFTGLYGGSAIELNLKNGELVRSFQVGTPVSPTPLVTESAVLFGEGVHDTHHARIYSFNLKTGELTGSFETKGHIERPPLKALVKGEKPILLVPAGKDGLYAVDAESMKRVWQASIGHIDSTPAVDEQRVYIGTAVEKGFEKTPMAAFALDLKSGEVIWRKSLPTSAFGIPVLWKNLVCFSLGDVYEHTDYGQLACYDQKTGKESVTFNLAGTLIAKPLVDGNYILLADLHGGLYQVDMANKKVDWKIQVPAKAENFSSVVLDKNDRLVLPGDDGLYVYSRKTQKLLFNYKIKDGWKGTFENVVIRGDRWILGDLEGVVRVFRAL